PRGRATEARKADRITVDDRSGKFLKEWGKSGTGNGEFNYPGGLAAGRDGRLYVADQTNRRVQVFDAEGKFVTKWGEYGVKPGQVGGNVIPKSRARGPPVLGPQQRHPWGGSRSSRRAERSCWPGATTRTSRAASAASSAAKRAGLKKARSASASIGSTGSGWVPSAAASSSSRRTASTCAASAS